MFRIQIFYPEAGLFMNTNHESSDIGEMKKLLQEASFAGMRCQIVDEEGTVHFGPAERERTAPMSIDDLAKSLGAQVISKEEFFDHFGMDSDREA